MKKIMIVLLVAATFGIQETKAQVSVHINIGNQPAWGPTGYNYAGFYYLPDINCYYDINRSMFIYPNGPRWVYARHLPSRYRTVNLYHTYKVVVNQPDPYRYNRAHVREYARYRNRYDQPMIRDSRDNRYYANPGHPKHKDWKHDRRGRHDNRRNDHRR